VFALILFAIVILIIVVAITAIAQPPEKWVRWFTGKK
jgi:hypothetical protein